MKHGLQTNGYKSIALPTHISNHCRDKQACLCSLELNVEVVFLCLCGFVSKHTFTDLFSDLRLHLFHLKQRFLPVAFRPSALCAVHDKSCETQHAIRQWQPTMQQWSSKCVTGSERERDEQTCVCLYQHVKFCLFKTLARTDISPAVKEQEKKLSVTIWEQGCVQKCTLIKNVTPNPTCAAHTITPGMQKRGHTDGGRVVSLCF